MIKKHDGNIVEGDAVETSTIVLVGDASGKKKIKEGWSHLFWQVRLSWVTDCIRKKELLDFAADPDEDYVICAPKDVSNPLIPFLSKSTKEFTLDHIKLLEEFTMGHLKKSASIPWDKLPKALKEFGVDVVKQQYAAMTEEWESSDSSSEEEKEDEDPELLHGKVGERRKKQLAEKAKKETIEAAKAAKAAKEAKKIVAATSANRAESSKTTTAPPEEEEEEIVATTKTTAAKHVAHGFYTKQEDDELWEFALANPTLSATEMWDKAKQMGICSPRTKKSMQRAFLRLQEKRNRIVPVLQRGRARAFLPHDDELMLMCIRDWSKSQTKHDAYGVAIWKAAKDEGKFQDFMVKQLVTRFHNRFGRHANWKTEFEKLSAKIPTALPELTNKKSHKAAVAASPKPAASVPNAAVAATPKPATTPKTPKTKLLTSSSVDVLEAVIVPEDVDIPEATIAKVASQVQDKTFKQVKAALFQTCGKSKPALSLLRGEEPDSELERWTASEDEALRNGVELARPDASRRRNFLGLPVD